MNVQRNVDWPSERPLTAGVSERRRPDAIELSVDGVRAEVPKEVEKRFRERTAVLEIDIVIPTSCSSFAVVWPNSPSKALQTGLSRNPRSDTARSASFRNRAP